jgi:hypothetical protein
MRPKSTIEAKVGEEQKSNSFASSKKPSVTIPRPFEFKSANRNQAKAEKPSNSNGSLQDTKRATFGDSQRNVTIAKPFHLQSALKPVKASVVHSSSSNSWKEKLKQQTENGISTTRPSNLRLHTEERAQKRKVFDAEKNMRFEAAVELRKTIQEQKNVSNFELFLVS